eukprot:CAMPEP_0181306674 /NCGR_PEP_ID=MMETSP1101-20121128/10436_1 /TAXON_ID=46948 /ORGANISM="Rhodomonas abbreviata, Strain Caron Lab Isolate" /LENGTH=489 /DNA_ID=CAMNT_0023412767 /DNA_START=368 /DNA_END=1834 /DNA_ORIENTATION=+
MSSVQSSALHVGVTVASSPQMAHGNGSRVPVLPLIPSGHATLPSITRGMFAADEASRTRNQGQEEERGVNDGADVLLRAAKKARSEVQPVRREEATFHVAIPARAPRGAYEPEEVARESGFIGVRWSRKKAKWRVRIKANGKDNHVGFFPDAVAAAMAYDKAAKRFFPQWMADPSVRLNFPEEGRLNSDTPSGLEASKSHGINAILAASGSETLVERSCLPACEGLSTPGPGSGASGVSSAPSCRSVGVSTVPQSGGSGGNEGGGQLSTVLVPLHIPREGGECDKAKKTSFDKSSLEHLLDDKTTLVRTPSPQDASVTPSMGLGGTASSISTPATLPSPSTLWSPSVSRCQSTSRGPYTETPPTIPGPPRLSAVACNTASFVAPAVCVAGQHSMAAKPEHVQLPATREETHNELEALRGLVELARENAPAVDFAIAHHKKVTARPGPRSGGDAGGGVGGELSAQGKKRDALSKKARERGRAVRNALSEA